MPALANSYTNMQAVSNHVETACNACCVCVWHWRDGAGVSLRRSGGRSAILRRHTFDEAADNMQTMLVCSTTLMRVRCTRAIEGGYRYTGCAHAARITAGRSAASDAAALRRSRAAPHLHAHHAHNNARQPSKQHAHYIEEYNCHPFHANAVPHPA